MTARTGMTAAALARAAAMAGFAPSVHNTQPWRWTILADSMVLSVVRERQLNAVDPEGRLLMISCGAALHHARAALAAIGWEHEVQRLPDPQRPDLLAVLTPTAHHEPAADAVRVLQDMERRHTDRRPLSDESVPGEHLSVIAEAVRAEGNHLHVLSGEQVYDLAAAADRAGAVETADPEIQQELAYWIGRGGGLGIPEQILPAEQPETTVPERNFGRTGGLPTSPGHDRAAAFGVIYGDGDEPESWLRAGEALSAGWLAATRLGVSVLPLSAAVEVLTTRTTLRRLISDLGWPYLVLRLGVADAEHGYRDGAGPAHTERLPVNQIVDTAEVRHLLDRA
ncbi:MAG TPA: nitroreductase family protein [Actinoplanes sp.]|nr:nitroreductase family protein [Actinoplanes sp.]